MFSFDVDCPYTPFLPCLGTCELLLSWPSGRLPPVAGGYEHLSWSAVSAIIGASAQDTAQ